MQKFLQFLVVSCLLLNTLALAQVNTSDSLYWKNRKPHAAYWQQDVAYKIHAVIDEVTHQIKGREQLDYTNNSPDTLRYVFFHLFQNAFVKDAYTHRLEEANKVRPRLGRYEAAGLGMVVNGLQAEGKPLRTEIDNTIMKVYLNEPLLPGQTLRMEMDFIAYFDNGGATRRRMKMYDAWGFMHYNGCQWYPKICVYDARQGWDTDQHMGKEFYGDFGNFDVILDFASNYIVEATGVLRNRDEVLPAALRRQLDIKNFADKPWNEAPSVIIPYKKGERKRWHFYAEHVHDFAFTADPTYRIGTAYWNGIECVAVAQEPHAAGWQTAADFTAQVIQTFSEMYGIYHYPKMVVADAADGSEYPMITMDAGREPGFRNLLVHEIGHSWFYGMVGNNETYRAALDEGFTQFINAEGLIKLDGAVFKEQRPKGWAGRFAEPRLNKDVRVFHGYIYDAALGADHQLNTHSDDFNGALGHGGGYRLVYYKAAAMLYNLQYVLGDSLFAAAMQHYVQQWKFAHPYFEDFRNSIIRYTKVDLNWFFDQWLETTKSIDYGIGRIRRIKGTDSFDIRFRRKGSMQMPLDVTIVDKNGGRQHYYIPNTWYEKSTDALTLPRWIGWGKLNKQYTARVKVPAGIQHVIIDTSQRLADRMMLNNYRSRPAIISELKTKLRLDAGLAPAADWTKYRLYHRPDIWYNALDGLKLGWHLNGAYLGAYYKFDATVWFNTQLGADRNFASEASWTARRLNYRFNFETPLATVPMRLTATLGSRFLDGLWLHKAGLHWTATSGSGLGLQVQTMYREGKPSLEYLVYPDAWSSINNLKNTQVQLYAKQVYKTMSGAGAASITARAPLLTGSFDYSYLEMEHVHVQWLSKLQLRSRIYARWGMGNKVPFESALFLAGASPEQMIDNKYVRSVGFVPRAWQGYNAYHTGHFQQGGGLNLRGYNGYSAFDRRDGMLYNAYRGRSGAAVNLELDFSSYIQWRPAVTRNWLSVNVYAFADAGVMELTTLDSAGAGIKTLAAGGMSDVRMDAGLGCTATIKRWGPLSKARPLTLRFDMPVWLNRPGYGTPQYLAPRWLLGISRAF